MDARVIGERGDAVLRTAMPGHDTCGVGLKSLRMQLSNSHASSPLFFTARGTPSSLSRPSKKPRGWSTEWRTSLAVAAFPFGERGRLSALHRGVLRRPVRAFGQSPEGHAVSELLAGHPSVPGQSPAPPGSSECVSPNPRAPHPAPPSRRLMRAPSMSRTTSI